MQWFGAPARINFDPSPYKTTSMFLTNMANSKRFCTALSWLIVMVVLFSSLTAQTVIVTSSNLLQKGWTEDQVNTVDSQNITSNTSPHVELVKGPVQHGLWQGSMLLELPQSGNEILRRVRMRNSNHAGTHISDLMTDSDQTRTLKYSTYITKNKNQSSPVLALQVDNNGDNIADFNISYAPERQEEQEVIKNQWQVWNASAGLWRIFVLSIDPHEDLDSELFTLAKYDSIYPDARIVNSGGGAIRITIGGDSPDYKNFEGYVDSFAINNPGSSEFVLYDFVFCLDSTTTDSDTTFLSICRKKGIHIGEDSIPGVSYLWNSSRDNLILPTEVNFASLHIPWSRWRCSQYASCGLQTWTMTLTEKIDSLNCVLNVHSWQVREQIQPQVCTPYNTNFWTYSIGILFLACFVFIYQKRRKRLKE